MRNYNEQGLESRTVEYSPGYSNIKKFFRFDLKLLDDQDAKSSKTS